MDRVGKLKFAIDVSLNYTLVITIQIALGKVIPNLLLKGSKLNTALGIDLPRFIVSILVILTLIILSNVLKRNIQGYNSAGDKSKLFLVVGILLIASGILSIPTQVYLFKNYSDNIIPLLNDSTQYEQTRLMHGKYTYIVPIVLTVLQIGLGAYFTFSTGKIKLGKKEA